ncbi:rCG62942, partial [Rattus norvegicus]
MWRVPRQTARGPCCETQSPHEIVQDKEARQQGLWWLHVRPVCPGQDQAGFPYRGAENRCESVEGTSTESESK